MKQEYKLQYEEKISRNRLRNDIDGGNSRRHKTAIINISHVFKELGGKHEHDKKSKRPKSNTYS